MEKAKKWLGDRKDGILLRNLDSMHFVMPIIYPNRCDNEAYISERVDLTSINAYINKKNIDEQDFPFTIFHIVITALLKTVTLRPKMNRFIANGNMYHRRYVSAAFVVKKLFSDDASEALAIVKAEEEDTIMTLREKIYQQITGCRSDQADPSTGAMNLFNKMPRFLSKNLIKFFCFMDRHGKVPSSFIETDPYYNTVVVSNLGSIKLRSGYHHLTNWGTTSVFCIIGEKKKAPFFREDGSMELRETVDLGLTIDERLADGYYYSKTVKLLKELLENPELLEMSMNREVKHDNCKSTMV